MFVGGGDQSFAIGLVDRDRLFDQHMQALLEGGDSDGGVVIMRRGDQDGVHASGFDQCRGVMKGEAAQLLGKAVCLLGMVVADRAQFHVANLAGIPGMACAHAADPDDSQSDCIHYDLFLQLDSIAKNQRNICVGKNVSKVCLNRKPDYARRILARRANSSIQATSPSGDSYCKCGSSVIGPE